MRELALSGCRQDETIQLDVPPGGEQLMRFTCCHPTELIFGRGRIQELGTIVEVAHYSGPNLPIGDHRILVKKTGFKTAQCQPVILKVQARVRLMLPRPGGGQ